MDRYDERPRTPSAGWPSAARPAGLSPPAHAPAGARPRRTACGAGSAEAAELLDGGVEASRLAGIDPEHRVDAAEPLVRRRPPGRPAGARGAEEACELDARLDESFLSAHGRRCSRSRGVGDGGPPARRRRPRHRRRRRVAALIPGAWRAMGLELSRARCGSAGEPSRRTAAAAEATRAALGLPHGHRLGAARRGGSRPARRRARTAADGPWPPQPPRKRPAP